MFALCNIIYLDLNKSSVINQYKCHDNPYPWVSLSTTRIASTNVAFNTWWITYISYKFLNVMWIYILHDSFSWYTAQRWYIACIIYITFILLYIIMLQQATNVIKFGFNTPILMNIYYICYNPYDSHVKIWREMLCCIVLAPHVIDMKWICYVIICEWFTWSALVVALVPLNATHLPR
jgi:hypothetical protein